VSGSVIDIVLVLLILLFAINGYRQGFLVGLLSFVGFFGGALLGLQLGPLIASHLESDSAKVIVSLTAVFGLAVAGQAVASFVATKLRNSIRNRTLQGFDNAGGALVSVIAVLLVMWLVAAPLASSSLPWLAKSVKNSAILGAVDRIMPDEADKLSDALRDTVDTNGFPDVFDGLSPTRVKNVEPPDESLVGSPLVANAKQSVVKVRGTADSCDRRIEGSGFIYAPERVMTNAHVVAGTKKLTVELNGTEKRATVVVYDPQRDLAVLAVPGLKGTVVKFTQTRAATGTNAIVIGFPLDGPYDARAARVRDVGDIVGRDIYNNPGKVTRDIYTIRALVRSGNSGGPLFATDGSVLGIIFAAAADDPSTGFAITAKEAAVVADAGVKSNKGTSTGDCAH
jgi:S1-C subfamily serine protease